jgi:type II secretory ATPase GspE/PulE/Tfp pilus assembly ATPase PilB-like protein
MLLTGPTGSGKTTTIYACLTELAAAVGRHIITIEDPVEQVLPGIMQTEVNEARGLSFARAAKHLLRQDPQVIVSGEIRDEETANIAVRAALTGHLVISTLHAGSCSGVFERLQVMCADQSAVTTALELITNQRLMRRLCAECRGTGCEACLRTGYQGRIPLMEWFQLTDATRTALRNKGAETIAPQETLLDQAREVVRSGLSNEKELDRIFGK